MGKLADFYRDKKRTILAAGGLILCLAAIGGLVIINKNKVAEVPDGGYTILAANDLGMHCYNPDFSGFLILPPANNLNVQVFQRHGEEAELVTEGITVTYDVIDNSFSEGKTNFWDYAADYGFDVPPNIGITGNGLSGECVLSPDGLYYMATAIPLTPYNDGSTEFNPYQLVHIAVTDAGTGELLAETSNVVLPVSNEMDCGNCHGAENTDLNILKAHDELSGTDLALQLEAGQRYKCADCHQDNSLGLPGKAGVPPLSQAMHGFHADHMAGSDVSPVCYNCHPGPVTKCYRGRMYLAGVGCVNSKCHGDMENVAQTQVEGRQAWLEEPDCGVCHGAEYAANPDTLYDNSYLLNSPDEEMNGIIRCESCHNSAHAEWKSSLPRDNLLPRSLQGYPTYIQKCNVCHPGEGKMHQAYE